LSWTTAVGVVLSLAIGIVASVVSADAGLGLVSGLLSTVITLQIDLTNKIEHRQRKEDEVSQLLTAMDEIPWFSDQLRQLCGCVNHIQSSPELRPLGRIARQHVQACTSVLQGLRLGQYQVPISDMQVKFEQLEQVQTSVLLTSIDHSDLAWWYTDEGRNYWDANRAALQRPGLRFERVFIYKDWTDELAALVKEQATTVENGKTISVFAVHRDKLQPELRIDMAIWDEKFTYQVELNSDGTPINNRFSVNRADIERRLDDFRRIKACARTVDPTTGQIVNSAKPSRNTTPAVSLVEGDSAA
jgi:hypothetical protein